MSAIDTKLAELGITLPTPSAPVANYVSFVQSGTQLVISGQLPLGADGTVDARFKGKVGGDVTPEVAAEAARLAAINVLAQAQAAVGDLSRIVRIVRLGGFINVAPGFTAVAPVMNGASDLVVAVLGDAGRHARSTVGVAELPLGAAVEVEALIEVA
ncbi:MAG: RidA family protein [Pseudochelatococcus sp.]|jgi:enamine deaminase RidA (YjgF/YER057c/UK114 family)|uniref:RidA family protein n=1 Tax=Pseudochelatococcus sp. TaxID=2020869 RepID=UPI003D92AF37